MKLISADNFRTSVLLSVSTRSPSCWDSEEELSGMPTADKSIEEQGRKTAKERCLRPRDETHDSAEEREAAPKYTLIACGFSRIGQRVTCRRPLSGARSLREAYQGYGV
jgi:hypothetical protein